MTLEIQTGGRRRCRCKHFLQEFDKLRNTRAQTHVLNCKDNPYKLKLAKDIAHGVSAPMLGTVATVGRSAGKRAAATAMATLDKSQPLMTSASHLQRRCPRGYLKTSTTASYVRLIATAGVAFVIADNPWFLQMFDPLSGGRWYPAGTVLCMFKEGVQDCVRTTSTRNTCASLHARIPPSRCASDSPSCLTVGQTLRESRLLRCLL
ncbi:unnamed protein product [Phaeothamnion confervicola]